MWSFSTGGGPDWGVLGGRGVPFGRGLAIGSRVSAKEKRIPLRKTLLSLLIALVALATPASAVDSNFYRGLMDRGMSSYAAGDYPAAAKLLRIASFGLLDSAADYERSLVFLALAQQKSGLAFDAKETVVKLLGADRIMAVYATLDLDSATRAEFNELARASLSEQQYAFLQDRTRKQASTPVAAPPPLANPTIEAAPPASVPAPSPVPAPAPSTTETAAAEREIERLESEAAQREALRREVEQSSAARAEALQAEAARVEAARVEAARIEAARVEAARIEAARIEAAARIASAGETASREAAAATEAARIDAAQREAARLETQNRLAEAERATREAAERDRLTREQSAREELIAREREAAAERERLDRAAVVSREEAELAARINRESADRATSSVVSEQLPPATGKGDAATTRQLNEAELLVDQGRITDARAVYRQILRRPTVSRAEALRVGEGLYRTLDFADSVVAFSRLRSLGSGEEVYRFYVAAALYETGEFAAAKLQMQCALPHIKPNDDVLRYWVKIENAR